MIVIVLNIVVGLILAFGGGQEVIVRGIIGGERIPFIVGAIGTAVSLMLSLSGVALWRRWHGARGLALLACALVALFSVMAALPPPRYVGFAALLLGVCYPFAVGIHLMRQVRGQARV